MTSRLLPRWATVGALLLAALAAVPLPAQGGKRPSRSPAPTVIGITEVGGFNVLHEDFRASSPRAPLPPGIPRPVEIALPSSGSFEDRVEEARAGALGALRPDTLYHLKGTRVLLYIPRDAGEIDIFDDSEHATGTASAAIGRKHGTAPDSYLVFVPRASEPGWAWLADQPWIDVISTSYYPVVNRYGRCHPATYVREIWEQGRIVFAAAGNFEQAGFLSSPAGTPEAYQVGGSDESGRTYLPTNPTNPAVFPTRLYETADRFDFPAADWQSLDGSMAFGGTSGAAPSTAGRAATLIARARALLGDRRIGLKGGALAKVSGKAAVGGLLKDGALTAPDLVDVLHQSAVPAEAPSPFRYLIEGYGAHSHESIEHAFQILTGAADPVARPDEDAMHEQVEAVRTDAHDAACSA